MISGFDKTTLSSRQGGSSLDHEQSSSWGPWCPLRGCSQNIIIGHSMTVRWHPAAYIKRSKHVPMVIFQSRISFNEIVKGWIESTASCTNNSSTSSAIRHPRTCHKAWIAVLAPSLRSCKPPNEYRSSHAKIASSQPGSAALASRWEI